MPSAPLTILLLDEEPLLRRATVLLLARRGASVTAAATADEAVALSEAHLYDVGILDVAPEGPSAPDVLQRMRAGGLPPRRVIAISSAPLHGREAERFATVLQKPYPFDALVRAVFGLRGRRRARSGVFERAGEAHIASAAPRPSPLRARSLGHAAPVTSRRSRGAQRAERGRG